MKTIIKVSESLVALDGDGVIMNLFGPLLPRINSHFGLNLAYKQITNHQLHLVAGCTVEGMQELMHNFNSDLNNYLSLPPISDAIETINILRCHYNFCIITSRPDILKEVTPEWCRQAGCNFKIYYSEGANNPYAGGPNRKSKQKIAEELGAIALIEDNPHEFEDWNSDKVNPILVAQPWNRQAQMRRWSWGGIEDYFMSGVL